MKLVFIFGNAAVGKMTVGQQLMEITPLRLFHNHMMIEPVIEIFGRFNLKVTAELRDVVFENFSKTDEYGMIFTMMMNFDRDWDYVHHVEDIFKKNCEDLEVYYVELRAPYGVRLERNKTENRLKYKPSKRDLDASARRLMTEDKYGRWESEEGEYSNLDNYLVIDNTNVSAGDAAEMIKDYFGFCENLDLYYDD